MTIENKFSLREIQQELDGRKDGQIVSYGVSYESFDKGYNPEAPLQKVN